MLLTLTRTIRIKALTLTGPNSYIPTKSGNSNTPLNYEDRKKCSPIESNLISSIATGRRLLLFSCVLSARHLCVCVWVLMNMMFIRDHIHLHQRVGRFKLSCLLSKSLCARAVNLRVLIGQRHQKLPVCALTFSHRHTSVLDHVTATARLCYGDLCWEKGGGAEER